MMQKLDRPIFIVGHARGGTTILAAVVNWHSYVGPKKLIRKYNKLDEFLMDILNPDIHLTYSNSLEQKEVWFDYFSGEDVFTHMGREIIVEKTKLIKRDREDLICRLTSNFYERRYLSKAPTNSFRVKVIRELFPDAKILAIYRTGVEVVSSWGKRSYGFGNKVSWGELKCRKLSYRKGLRIFARKWFETIEYLEGLKTEVDLMSITYDDLIESPQETLKRVFHHLELPIEDYVRSIRFVDRRLGWRREIPLRYHNYLAKLTDQGMRLYSSVRLGKGTFMS